MKPFKLFHYWRSSCSWRLRWALNLKKLAFEPIAVPLLENEQNSHEFLKKNPSGLVPALETPDGQLFSQSLSILEWLDETYPQPALLPDDPKLRQQCRALAQIIACDTQPIQNLRVLHAVEQLGSNKASWARQWIEAGLRAYETVAQKYSGQFSLGAVPTHADLCLIPQVYNAHRFKVDMSQFPRVQTIYEHALQTEACERAAPENFQP